ncbi:ribonuclease Z [Defluviitalea phaphyphila]|uniref:ribonuclease Z n=1 Tax=Defluviitalea phaphyphila TaxID=1473580 RepID=UPI000730CDDA|nr:ribonuclease Z [Defluviitalea phaphyphila]
MLDVCLLGTGGMMPLPNRWLTALLVRCNGRKILVDCGEGTQITLKMLGWGFKTIDTICFTHYHGDHVTGLGGLLLTIGNSGRTEPLTLIGPVGLKKVVEGLTVIAPDLPFELNYIELKEEETRLEIQKGLFVKTVPVEHTISCFAYVIELERKSKFNPEKAIKLGIPVTYWKKLQDGEAVEWNNKYYTPDMVLGNKRKGIKVSYCTDSRPTTGLVNSIKNSDLFICEGMYGDEEDKIQAYKNKHMTFSEAATLAKEAEVKELWLTHFSPALKEPDQFIKIATDIFPNTIIGKTLMMKSLTFY